jgi:shikimate kinase
VSGEAARRVILVGPMGSGKTTLGRRAARLLNLDFVDCDEEIESRCGASVNLIFDIEGEAGFRARERRMLKELAARDQVLIATGGGVVLDPKNRQLLKQAGLVVWLQTQVDQQLRRLDQDRKRPLLQTPDRRKRLLSMAAERNPLYEDVSDLVYRTRQRGVARAAQDLASRIEKHWKCEETT